MFGFRIWKYFVRHFSDSVISTNSDVNLHLRNNIIKIQSLVHNQLFLPRYINIFKQGWFKSNYIGKKPEVRKMVACGTDVSVWAPRKVWNLEVWEAKKTHGKVMNW